MSSLRPLKCNIDQFTAIYQNLTLFGSEGHEGICLNTSPQRPRSFFPMTIQKKWSLLFKELNYQTAAYVLDFFEKNLKHLAAQSSSPHPFFLKFRSEKSLSSTASRTL
jgi:hypothetical protein